VKRTFASSLVILLAAPPFASPQAPAAISVAHSPVNCMVAGTNPQIEAGITPSPQVKVGRVYFKSALGGDFYYVEMVHARGRYIGLLPRPLPGAGSITYYVEGMGRDFTQSQTQENSAAVVPSAEDCRDKLPAAAGPSGPVRVFSTSGATAVPPGFTGVSTVMAAGAGAGTGVAAGTGAAAGGGSFFTSTAGIITLSAVALGVAAAIVIATHGDDNPPASPAR
jgi:hypothetical protein